MGLGDNLRTKFWAMMDEGQKMRQITPEEQSRLRDEKTKKRAEKFIKNLNTLQQVASEVEKYSQVSDSARRIVQHLNPAIVVLKRFTLSVNLGIEAAKAAEEVHAGLQILSAKAQALCEENHKNDEGQAWSCMAKYERQYHQRAVHAVLSLDNQDSWVNKVWERWSKVILDFLL